MTTDEATLARSRVFPKAETEAKLKEALLRLADSVATMREIELPTQLSEKLTAAIQLDSLDVVDVLCELEPVVGIELKDSLVKSGGYSSIHQAVGHLLPRIEAAWNKPSTKGATR